jgi:hypothetical protein
MPSKRKLKKGKLSVLILLVLIGSYSRFEALVWHYDLSFFAIVPGQDQAAVLLFHIDRVGVYLIAVVAQGSVSDYDRA